MNANNFTFCVSCNEGAVEIKATPNMDPIDIITILTTTLALVPEDLQEYALTIAKDVSKLSKQRLSEQVH